MCPSPASGSDVDARHSRRDMLLQDVFVPGDAEVLPPGLFGAMYNAFPHLFLSFSVTVSGSCKRPGTVPSPT